VRADGLRLFREETAMRLSRVPKYGCPGKIRRYLLEELQAFAL